MKSVVVVPTIRQEWLGEFLDSLRTYPQKVDEVHLLAQAGTQDEWERVVKEHPPGLPVVLEWQPDPEPPYLNGWAHAAEHPDVDAWLRADDDLLVTAQTDWGYTLKVVHSGAYGVVASNFVRSTKPGAMRRAWPPGNSLWVNQAFTNTSGGMAVAGRVIPYLVEPDVDRYGYGLADWQFDDIQVGLTAYLNGERCARFRGSLAVHRSLSKGGLCGPTGQFSKRTFRSPPSQWINLRPQKAVYHNGNDWHMPVPGDITRAAREAHRRARSLHV